jgi:uncharacterized protein
MLISFKLRNFLSYSGEQHFTFAASGDSGHLAAHVIPTALRAVPRLSKAAMLVGPNGSGKTNLLIALSTLRLLVLRSSSLSETEFQALYTPNASSPANVSVEFQIEILLGMTRYRYGLAFTSCRVCSEKLEVYTSVKSQRWFAREALPSASDDRWAPFSSSFNGAREMWRKSTGPRELFITVAAKLGAAQLSPLTDWFEHQLDIALQRMDDQCACCAATILQPKYKTHLLRMFNAVDIPVRDVRPHRHNLQVLPGVKEERPLLEFLHDHSGTNIWVDPQFESAGTKRLVHIFARLIAAIEGQKLLALDEFDISLHPMIAKYLLNLISGPNSRAQLLVSTHKAVLMDLSILRRDEIWLVHLDENRATQLHRLCTKGPRRHEVVMKGYMKGRYGAVPSIH